MACTDAPLRSVASVLLLLGTKFVGREGGVRLVFCCSASGSLLLQSRRSDVVISLLVPFFFFQYFHQMGSRRTFWKLDVLSAALQ